MTGSLSEQIKTALAGCFDLWYGIRGAHFKGGAMQELGQSIFETGNPGLVMILLIIFSSIFIVMIGCATRSFYMKKFKKVYCCYCGQRSLFSRKESYVGENGGPYSIFYFECPDKHETSA